LQIIYHLEVKMKLKFNDSQDFQIKAIDSITDLFIDFGNYAKEWDLTSDDILSNIPEDEDLDEDWLLTNLNAIQNNFNSEMDARQTPTMKIDVNRSLDLDRGQMLEGVKNDVYQYPTFSVEMETGTGKTYVYLRTIYKLNKEYGFSKFIIVVPSVAIYQGVKKSFDIMKDHFETIFGKQIVALRAYDSSKMQEVKAYATNRNIEILLMTLASFNSTKNNIYKRGELPGDLYPYEYIQKTRPIVFLDEPQNMNTQQSKDAIRTLKPLFSIRYSATHKETPNLTYRLTPVEAFRRNLVKKIQVIGITESETGGKPLMSLKEVKGTGKSAKAIIVTNTERNGLQRLEEITLKTGDSLQEKTNKKEHSGHKVSNIGSGKGQEFIEFENGLRLSFEGGDGISRPDIFRFQIRETILQHIQMQERLLPKGIKVLSLFFVDKVANFVGDGKTAGIIKNIYKEEFNKLKSKLNFYKDKDPEELQASYFASYKKGRGANEQVVFLDDEASNDDGRKAEREQFELIMTKKEELLSLSNPVCFIFAHSALKEGWDSPNVFQICTLNQTISVSKKRQEIGRGLRLAVDQNGERIFDDQVNILTVVANESYESFANTLQSEYSEKEGGAPPAPKPKRAPANRQEKHYAGQEFKEFWDKLLRKSKFEINIDTEKLIALIRSRCHNEIFPDPKLIITKGKFVITNFIFKLKGFEGEKAILDIIIENSRGLRKPEENLYVEEGTDLEKALKEPGLRGFIINSIDSKRTNPEVVFKNGEKVTKFKQLVYEVSDNRDQKTQEVHHGLEKFKVFNVVDKIEEATSLTKKTCLRIFEAVPQDKRIKIFTNPEGFTNKLIDITKNALADHIADNIVFETSDEILTRDIEELFPKTIEYVQTEVVPTPLNGLYDITQKDSEIEEVFISTKLEKDNKVLLFFKFPSKYRIHFPKLIGNYNPDWAIVRKADNGNLKIELVRETKGTTDIEKLRFSHEIRKIKVAEKHFAQLGIDYRVIKGDENGWWKSYEEDTNQITLYPNLDENNNLNIAAED
jgi:type III restriction enzyme